MCNLYTLDGAIYTVNPGKWSVSAVIDCITNMTKHSIEIFAFYIIINKHKRISI